MSDRKSILQHIKSEDYKEGLGQASQVEYDDAWQLGYTQGYKDTASGHKSFLIAGFFLGYGFNELVGVFF